MGWKLLLLASFAAFQHNTFVFIQQFLRRDKCSVLVGWNKGWAAGGQAQILPEARDTEKQSHLQRLRYDRALRICLVRCAHKTLLLISIILQQITALSRPSGLLNVLWWKNQWRGLSGLEKCCLMSLWIQDAITLWYYWGGSVLCLMACFVVAYRMSYHVLDVLVSPGRVRIAHPASCWVSGLFSEHLSSLVLLNSWGLMRL